MLKIAASRDAQPLTRIHHNARLGGDHAAVPQNYPDPLHPLKSLPYRSIAIETQKKFGSKNLIIISNIRLLILTRHTTHRFSCTSGKKFVFAIGKPYYKLETILYNYTQKTSLSFASCKTVTILFLFVVVYLRILNKIHVLNSPYCWCCPFCYYSYSIFILITPRAFFSYLDFTFDHLWSVLYEI